MLLVNESNFITKVYFQLSRTERGSRCGELRDLLREELCCMPSGSVEHRQALIKHRRISLAPLSAVGNRCYRLHRLVPLGAVSLTVAYTYINGLSLSF